MGGSRGRSLTWGLSPRCGDPHRARCLPPEGWCCVHACPPYPATHPPLSAALPGTTSTDWGRSQSVIMDAQPWPGQEYFEKCSLSCHLQFGFKLLELFQTILAGQQNRPVKATCPILTHFPGRCGSIPSGRSPSSNGVIAGRGALTASRSRPPARHHRRAGVPKIMDGAPRPPAGRLH